MNYNDYNNMYQMQQYQPQRFTQNIPMWQQYQQNQQQQQNNIQMLKGRPVSSYDEAKACMIDMDGSMFVFTDIANKKIYTKQILMDGSAELKTYNLEEQKQTMQTEQNEYVSMSQFEKTINAINKQMNKLQEVFDNEYASNNSANV